MLSYLATLRSLTGDKRGIAAIEYALIASLMAVILVAAFPTLNTALDQTFTNISYHLTNGK